MKNNDFEKELSRKIGSEEITLPESLSAENIEKLIGEKGGIIEPKRIRTFNRKSVTQWASAAAMLVILVGVVAVLGLGNPLVEKENKLNDEQQQQIIENHVAPPSDYSALHKTVLSYYKDIYNRIVYAQDDSDGFFGGIFDDFGAKNEAAMDMAVGNTALQAVCRVQHLSLLVPSTAQPTLRFRVLTKPIS